MCLNVSPALLTSTTLLFLQFLKPALRPPLALEPPVTAAPPAYHSITPDQPGWLTYHLGECFSDLPFLTASNLLFITLPLF